MAIRLSRLDRKESRDRRHRRIRQRIRGTEARPRASVYRSSMHIYVQVVNDDLGKVLFGCSTRTPDLRKVVEKMTPIEASKEVGKLMAKMASERGVKEVCFDRGGYPYHGRVKALAEGAREGGLKF